MHPWGTEHSPDFLGFWDEAPPGRHLGLLDAPPIQTEPSEHPWGASGGPLELPWGRHGLRMGLPGRLFGVSGRLWEPLTRAQNQDALGQLYFVLLQVPPGHRREGPTGPAGG